MREDAKMEQMPVTIEIAGPSDAQAIAELKFENLMHRAQTGKLEMSTDDVERAKVSAESLRLLTEMLTNTSENDYYLVAKNNGEVAGFCRMIWQPDLQQYQFRQFYVHPKYMGKKIGGKIMAVAKERARHSEHASKGMFLYTGHYNKAAQSMYEHWGFHHTTSKESLFEQHGNKNLEWVKMEDVF
jgi:GNAT superfamily N-acetyltransferase